MKQKSEFLILGFIVAIFFVGLFFFYTRSQQEIEREAENMNMTPEEHGMMGSSIPSPTPSLTPSPTFEENQKETTITIHIGETKTVLGVSITPLELLEDSRCAKDVTCIWAGTVRVKTSLKNADRELEHIFTLNEKLETEVWNITFMEVKPETSSKEEIPSDKYEFIFKIEKK